MELGNKIRQLRYKAKLTQEQLADKLGIGAQSVSKWENSAAMPDITLLPLIAETFGVSIDDLFDLTTEQKLNRIENRLDVEEDLPQDLFRDYEEFLKIQITTEAYKKKATELMAYLWWCRMYAAAQNVKRYAKESIRMAPGEKNCQYMLNMAEGHYPWDWNMHNHSAAIDFYKEMIEIAPDNRMPYYYLIDNLIADHRADEAEQYLEKLIPLDGVNPVLIPTYRAYIALARFDEPEADRIMEEMMQEYGENDACLFETAQYYAHKGNYLKAIDIYELAYEKDEQRPRFIDALMAIMDIYQIMGDYRKAAETCERIIQSQREEWGMEEETELKTFLKIKAELLEKIQAEENRK